MATSSFRRGRASLFVITYLVVFSLGFALARDLSLGQFVTTGSGLSELEEQGEFAGAANIVAVAEENGEGILGKVNVEFVPGDGDLLFNIDPFVEPDTQYSAQIAVVVAHQYAGVDISNKDVVVTFDIPDEVGLVGGPSAGAATTIAAIAAIQNKTVNPSIALTGTVDMYGNIGHVGGILAKVRAADSVGIKLFLIPSGEMNILEYEEIEIESRIPFLRTIQKVPRMVNVQEYARENNLAIEVREVSTIEEAVEFMIQ